MAALNYVLLAASSAIVAAPASGQCRLCEQPTVSAPANTAAGDVELQVETSLSFDRMILSGPGKGAVTIRPDGSNGVEGAVIEVGPRATVGTVLVHGEPNRMIRIELPRRIQLFSVTGGQITLDDVSTDTAGVTRLDSAGNLNFRFGGRLVLSGDCDGPYRGDLPITVEYTN